MATSTSQSISEPSSTEESPEYITMRESYDKLVDFLSASIVGLAGKLFARNLIPKAIMDKLRMSSIPEADKTGEVLSHLMSRVKLYSSAFKEFVDILKKHDPSNRPIVEMLIASHKSHTEEVMSYNSS